MKANEFVKKFGWDKVKEVASFSSNVCADPTHFDSDLDIYVHSDDFKGVMDESGVCIVDLKRLVVSHWVVSLWGGLGLAKKVANSIPSDGNSYTITRDDTQVSIKSGELKQAIADVESCQ